MDSKENESNKEIENFDELKEAFEALRDETKANLKREIATYLKLSKLIGDLEKDMLKRGLEGKIKDVKGAIESVKKTVRNKASQLKETAKSKISKDKETEEDKGKGDNKEDNKDDNKETKRKESKIKTKVKKVKETAEKVEKTVKKVPKKVKSTAEKAGNKVKEVKGKAQKKVDEKVGQIRKDLKNVDKKNEIRQEILNSMERKQRKNIQNDNRVVTTINRKTLNSRSRVASMKLKATGMVEKGLVLIGKKGLAKELARKIF